MRTRIGLGLALLLAQAACTGSVFNGGSDAGDPGTGDDAGSVHGGGNPDAGTDASPEAEPPPPGCDTSKLPTEDVCVVNDAEGIFVSSSLGKATGDGTKASPLASLAAGIEAAKAAHKRVYACAETYGESIAIENGVDVFGYFACNSSWAVVQTSHAKVASPTSPAATATNVTTPTRVENVDLVAPDFTSNSQSSIALIASGSPSLTIKNATIHAGTGGDGAHGTDGVQLSDSSNKKGLNGIGYDICNGAIGHCVTAIARYQPGPTNACVGEAGHDAGPGGDGGWNGVYVAVVNQNQTEVWKPNGQASTVGLPLVGSASTTQGGGFLVVPSNGANGLSGFDGQSGGPIGTISANGYTPADGTGGTDGQPGQGGGGAAGLQDMNGVISVQGQPIGRTAQGEGGASGGAGGCPGLAGTAGKGGGASIALIAVQSGLTLDTVTIESSSGGIGGQSGQGSKHTVGGTGGAASANTVHAANGGDGGYAGVSGNGGGGPSVGIAFAGSAPQRLATTIKQGAGGAGQLPRTGLDGKTIPASSNGASYDLYDFGS